jgi:membrane protease YdiL (CAAX protease family)/curved DNA-binding protein CbpA
MAIDFDPYRILEVDPSAGREQIDEAYRRQWAAYPRDPAPDARLREIQAAYRILSDPAERRSYDERRQAAAAAPVAVAEGAVPSATGTSLPADRLAGANRAVSDRTGELVAKGYSILHREKDRVDLVGRRDLSWAWTLALFIFGIGAGVAYVIDHFSRNGHLVQLRWTEEGTVKEDEWFAPGGAQPKTSSGDIHQRVASLVDQGYRVVLDTPATVDLIGKKKFAVGWALFWTLLFIIPLFAYLIYHFERRICLKRVRVGENGDSLEETWYRSGSSSRQIWPVSVDEPQWGSGDIVWAIVAIVVIVIVASIPIFVAAIAIAGGSDNVDKSPNALAVELLASAVFQVSALGAAWYFGLRKYHLNWAALGLRKPERGWPWLPFTLVLGALFIVFAYSIMLSIAGIKPNTDLPDAVYNHFLPLSIALVLTVLIAPVIEETFFRGFVFGGLMRRWGPVWGALGSGLLFGLAHLGNAGYFYVVPPIIGIGVLFAWSYRYSRSIFPSMAAHFLFNLIQMIGVLATR